MVLSSTHQIGIPHPHGVLHTDLAHQQAVHPPERKLHKLDPLCGKVLREWGIYARNELRHAFDAALDARLRGDVVVLDPIEQTRETPERIGLDCGEDREREHRRIDLFGISICGFASC